MIEQAVQYVMNFYNVPREDVVLYFWDEVLAVKSLLEAGLKL